MEVSLIAAVDEQGGIGKDNDLPWPRIPADMKNFREVTDGGVVIMGRKTWESIPEKFKPLPDRHNVIVSRTMTERIYPPVKRSLDEALEYAFGHATKPDCDIFIIGGASLYNEALERKLIDRMYLTRVHGTYPADTFFPEWPAKEWRPIVVDTVEGTSKAPSITLYEFVPRSQEEVLSETSSRWKV